MRCCTLTRVTKILMRAKSNVRVGRVWAACRRFPTIGILYDALTSICNAVNLSMHGSYEKHENT